MTASVASPHPVRRAPWALWTALLAMLLALQASAGATRPAAYLESGVIAAKLVQPAPLAAQFRDTGHTLKAGGQRLSAAKSLADQDGAAPPLQSGAPALIAAPVAGGALYAGGASAPCGDALDRANRARAPPLSA